jgi:hypothetical protein
MNKTLKRTHSIIQDKISMEDNVELSDRNIQYYPSSNTDLDTPEP